MFPKPIETCIRCGAVCIYQRHAHASLHAGEYGCTCCGHYWYVPRPKNDVSTVTVCAECLRASCWQGTFMCEQSQAAGTVEKTRDELKALGLEHPDYWRLCGELTS